jgi:chromosome transmission fidelity protein 1
LFESPTGTGKSLSIISSSLYWLEQEKNKPEEVIISEQLQPFLLKIIKDDPQWMKDATINKHKKDIIHNLQLRNTIKQQKNQTLQKIRAQKQQCKFKKQRFVTPLQNEDNDDFLINQDDQNRHLIEIPEERSSPEVESLPKIIYAARTHSQLQQFIHEIKKTKYNETKAITLASRKTLCINTTVSNLKDLPLINDKCMDLQKTKSLNCFCRGETKEHDEQMLLRYSDEAQALIQDIEDLKLLGKELKTCPYYGTRQAVIEADVVCVPYNLLFQESARKSSGIDLKNAVVIIGNFN